MSYAEQLIINDFKHHAFNIKSKADEGGARCRYRLEDDIIDAHFGDFGCELRLPV
jgi:hypothetical protein